MPVIWFQLLFSIPALKVTEKVQIYTQNKRRMQTLVFLKNRMCLVGIFPDVKQSKILQFVKNFGFLTAFVVFFLSSTWFLVFHAKKQTEYTECFYFGSCGLALLIIYGSNIWLSKEYAALFDNLDAVVEQSRFKRFWKQYFCGNLNDSAFVLDIFLYTMQQYD